MLGSFKIRLLVVIIIVTMVGLVMQSGNNSKEIVEPVLKYVMETDYDVGQVISNYLHIPEQQDSQKTLPIEGVTVLKIPCDFIEIERNFGWYWSSAEGRQEFCPGIFLKVKDNTLVKPILEGRVEEIKGGPENGTVLIRHKSNLVSVYGGLKEILVGKDTNISSNNPIGRTGNNFYFEVRSKDEPVNPQNIFK